MNKKIHVYLGNALDMGTRRQLPVDYHFIALEACSVMAKVVVMLWSFYILKPLNIDKTGIMVLSKCM